MESGENEILRSILERLTTRLQWILEQSSVDLDYLEYVCNQEYILIDAASRIFDIPSPITEGLKQLGRLVHAGIEEEQRPILFTLEQGERGRPKCVLSADFLTYLFEIPLPVKCVANLLGVSHSTIFRRMRELGISTKTFAVKARVPNAGYRLAKGLLQSEGYRVQWDRIKGSMHRIDSAGVLYRMTRMGSTVRRTYYVRGPLSLVHIDTNHKLIRYNIVIFGNVDGYSRKVLYLNAANNNKSSTALAFFLESVQRFGWPSRYASLLFQGCPE